MSASGTKQTPLGALLSQLLTLSGHLGGSSSDRQDAAIAPQRSLGGLHRHRVGATGQARMRRRRAGLAQCSGHAPSA